MLRILLTLAGIAAALAGAAQTAPIQVNSTATPIPVRPIGTIARPSVPVAPTAEIKQALAQPSTVLLDVRTPEEFATGHLQGAQNIDFRAPSFREKVAQLDKAKTYVLYCASGNRSGQSSVLMQETGFRKIINAGAFKDLKAAGLKTE
jgi:phage shock protein E